MRTFAEDAESDCAKWPDAMAKKSNKNHFRTSYKAARQVLKIGLVDEGSQGRRLRVVTRVCRMRRSPTCALMSSCYG